MNRSDEVDPLPLAVQTRIKKLYACATANEVRVLLLANNATGLMKSRQACPVAKYVRGPKLWSDLPVLIDSGSIVVRGHQFENPWPVRHFILDFDRGNYPSLVRSVVQHVDE